MSTPIDAKVKEFLPHVAGLRAIAIFLVVWFHLSQHNDGGETLFSLPQGFYGVDVFIVIMGYFLFFGFVRNPSITWKHFFQKKLSRLLLPLNFLILIICFLSLFFLDFSGLREMASTAICAMLGGANIQLKYSTSGYFAGDTSLNPLFHTWYIGVAVQLFVISYLLFLFLKNRCFSTILIVLSIVGVFSFICDMGDPIKTLFSRWGISTPWRYGEFSYYDVIPRIWELLAGGIVFLLPNVSNKKFSLLICICASFLVLIPSCSASTSSVVSVMVVLGTVFLIRYGRECCLSAILSNNLMLWLGKISFSLYLVHVPIIVFYKSYFFSSIGGWQAFYLFTISLIAACLFFYLIEKRAFSLRTNIVIGSVAAISCLFIWCTNGMRSIWNAESNSIDIEKYARPVECTFPGVYNGLNCDVLKLHELWYTGDWYEGIATNQKINPGPLFQLGVENKQPNFALIGDSHAEHFYAGFDAISKEAGLAGVFLASIIEPFWNRECPDNGDGYFYNRIKAEAFMLWLKNNPEIHTVIIGQYWQKMYWRKMDWDMNYIEPSLQNNGKALRDFCEQLKKLDKKVLIIAPLPRFTSSQMLRCARWLKRRKGNDEMIPPAYICTYDEYLADYGAINIYLNEMEKEGLCQLLRPHEHLFIDNKCAAFNSERLNFVDQHHISVPNSIDLSRHMFETIIPILNPK